VTLKLGFRVTQGHRKLHDSVGLENPTLEPNITSIGKPVCEVMAIFVYPRWPSAAILDFIEPQIAPFDPPTSKTLA